MSLFSGFLSLSVCFVYLGGFFIISLLNIITHIITIIFTLNRDIIFLLSLNNRRNHGFFKQIMHLITERGKVDYTTFGKS